MTKKRIPTGIKKLDEMMFGGFVPNSANLIEGAPGTGKTTIGMQYIYNGAVKYNEPGLIITFEEFPNQYYHDALQFGWDLRKLEDEGKLKIIFSDPETALNEFHNLEGQFTSLIEDMGIKRVVVDSMTYFESLSYDTYERREIECTFINSLKREGVTSILLKENDSLLGNMTSVSSKIPFIVDSYFLLRYVEVDSAIKKAVLILKMRGSDHHKDIRCYISSSKGIEVEAPFTGREGIMSGITHAMPTPQDAFIDAFGKKK